MWQPYTGKVSPHCTVLHFGSFFSGKFNTAIIVKPPERKLAKRNFVHCNVCLHVQIFRASLPKGNVGCILDNVLAGRDSILLAAADTPDTAFYQWVPFTLVFQVRFNFIAVWECCYYLQYGSINYSILQYS